MRIFLERSAHEHNAAGQVCDPGTEELLDLCDEIVQLIELKGPVDETSLELRTGNDDFPGPVAVDLVDHARQGAVAENKLSGLPGRNLAHINRDGRLQPAVRVGDLLAAPQF